MIRRHEILRRNISALCSAYYASEENPINCNVTIGHSEAMGLSELEMPQVTGVFHDSEAIVWVNILGDSEPMELDTLSTSELEDIYVCIVNNTKED